MSATAPIRSTSGSRTARQYPSPSVASRPVLQFGRGRAPGRRRVPASRLVAGHRTTAGRLPFLIVVGVVLVGGLVTMLMLHTIAAQDGFRVLSLQNRLAILDDQVQAQQQVVDAASAPGALQARAVALGMVPTTLSHLHARTGGRAVGQLVPNYVPPPASVNQSTTATNPASGTTASGATASGATAGTMTTTTHAQTTQGQSTKAQSTKTATATSAAGGRGHAHRSAATGQGSAGRSPAGRHQSHHRRSAARHKPSQH
jgi:hypothetical protein